MVDLRKTLLTSGLFDPVWYAERYPDVALTGMKPLTHFLTAGILMGRDPGPDFSETFMRVATSPFEEANKTALQQRLELGSLNVLSHKVILAAAALAQQGRIVDAVNMARSFLGRCADRPLKLFSANQAIQSGNETCWLAHLNDYLSPYKIAPLKLRAGISLLHRLTTDPVSCVSGGPLVSIVMPAYRAEKTIAAAVESILRQSWVNLELLIVDDASDDGTWPVLKQLATRDHRVRIIRNARNLGPYVSKNLALREACGDFITGHDADDWAHPQRIENHMRAILESEGRIKAGTNMMLRVSPTGLFDNVIASSEHHSPDGIRRRAFISCMFERETMQRTLGFYDCVRFGADGEMLRRAQKILGPAFQDLDLFAMICMDLPEGLTNHPELGLRTSSGASETRRRYNAAWANWHENTDAVDLFLPFPAEHRRFIVDPELYVPDTDIAQALGHI